MSFVRRDNQTGSHFLIGQLRRGHKCRVESAVTTQTLATSYEAFLAYLRDVKQRPDNTVRAYRSDLRGAATALTMPLGAITFRDIEGRAYAL